MTWPAYLAGWAGKGKPTLARARRHGPLSASLCWGARYSPLTPPSPPPTPSCQDAALEATEAFPVGLGVIETASLLRARLFEHYDKSDW